MVFTPVTPALERQGQEDGEFKAVLECQQTRGQSCLLVTEHHDQKQRVYLGLQFQMGKSLSWRGGVAGIVTKAAS